MSYPPKKKSNKNKIMSPLQTGHYTAYAHVYDLGLRAIKISFWGSLRRSALRCRCSLYTEFNTVTMHVL